MPVSSQRIWEWPEFIALCKRLDIPSKDVIDLELRVIRGENVVFKTTQLASDMNTKPSKLEDR